MPLYEFQCPECGRRDEVFSRSMTAELKAPDCGCEASKKSGKAMVRAISKFAQHKTLGDQLAEAEAKWGKQVESVMGPGPDVGRLARRYEELSKDLPPE